VQVFEDHATNYKGKCSTIQVVGDKRRVLENSPLVLLSMVEDWTNCRKVGCKGE